MADHKKLADKRTSQFWVDPVKIKVVPGRNARDLTTPDNAAWIEELAGMIEANGFMDDYPFILDDSFGIVAGHCRHAALMLLRAKGHIIESVPYHPERKGSDEVDRIIHQSVRAGKPLTSLEEGFNIKRLMKLNVPISDIAARTGRSDTYIEHLLTLQEAPSDIKEMVAQGEISAKTVVGTMRTEGDEEGADVIRDSVKAARAAGKKKVTPKDVQARVQAKDDRKRFRLAYRPKTGLLAVRIGQTEFPFTAEVWLDMAQRIGAEASKIIDERTPRAPLPTAEEMGLLPGTTFGDDPEPAAEAVA